ncbi:MAG: biotin--[acetyl-CoA-carboxylase] ligase [Ornithinimicrobium sp.]
MVSQPWTRPEWHATIDSTNTRLLADPTPGAVVVAEHQSAGSGRRGRQWLAPAGTSLAVSVALRSPSPDRAGWLPLVAGLAVGRALADHQFALPTVLKWPNDVLVPEADVRAPAARPAASAARGGKVCGILAQASAEVIVLGAGLNIDQRADQLPVPEATSWRLALGGTPLPYEVRHSWLTAYLRCLGELVAQLRDDLPAVVAAYLAQCDTIGRQVQVHLPGGSRSAGVATGVSHDGALMLQTSRGTAIYHAGDVVHLRPGAAEARLRS